MEVKELKIGNLVNVDFYDYPVEVDSVCRYDDGIFNGKIGDIPIHSISPIPLTEEWFLKFGFTRNEHKIFTSYNLNGLQFNFINGIWREYVRQIEVKSIHQLQNLYFALTNEELTIKQ